MNTSYINLLYDLIHNVNLSYIKYNKLLQYIYIKIHIFCKKSYDHSSSECYANLIQSLMISSAKSYDLQ